MDTSLFHESNVATRLTPNLTLFFIRVYVYPLMVNGESRFSTTAIKQMMIMTYHLHSHYLLTVENQRCRTSPPFPGSHCVRSCLRSPLHLPRWNYPSGLPHHRMTNSRTIIPLHRHCEAGDSRYALWERVAQRGLDKMLFFIAAGFTQRRLHASDAAE